MPDLTLLGANPLAAAMLLAVLDQLMSVLVVVAGIGLLIFVHELGHFLVAKWNKVRVEAFSLGFGPVLWGFRRGDTHYRLSAVPLGGYVKMAGETPGDEHTDDPAEFQNKGLLARASILVAGVVMNAIVAIILFVIAFKVGVPLEPPVVGGVEPGSAAWEAGLEPGDRVLRVGDHRPIDFIDLAQEIAFAKGPVDLLVSRDGQEILFPDVQPVKNRTMGIQFVGIDRLSESKVQVDEDSPAAQAGIRTGDEVLSIGGADARNRFAVQDALLRNRGGLPVVLRRDGETIETVLTPKRTPDGPRRLGVTTAARGIRGVRPGSAAERAGFEAGDRIVGVNGTTSHTYRQALDLAREAAPGEVVFTVRRGEKDEARDVALEPIREESANAWTDFFYDLQPEPGDVNGTTVSLMSDSAFEDGSPAGAAGLPEGARILAIDGHEVKSFADIQEAVAAVPEADPVKISWVLGDGPTHKAEVVRRNVVRSYLGLSWRWATETVRIDGIGASIAAGLRRSLYTAGTVLRMIGGIFAGRVSAKNLGGPITIFQVSYHSAKRNFLHFLYFLGILSVNLAILNVLPIPVLDGGHLLFILIEAIRRKPLSERAMGAFQYVGLLFLILLMLFVIANDVGRLLG